MKRPRIVSIKEPVKEERTPPSEKEFEFVEKHEC